MTTRLKLYNAALRYLGGTIRLQTLTDTRSERRELDAAYSDALEYMLEQANWNFALREVVLQPDGDVTVEFGRPYFYSRPADYVRLAGIAPDENFGAELTDYTDDATGWSSWSTPIYVRYVSSDAALGGNIGRFTPTYAEAMAAYLAYLVALPVTKDQGLKTDALAQHRMHLGRAKTIEALAEPVRRKPGGNWAAARYTGGINRSVRFGNGKIGWSG